MSRSWLGVGSVHLFWSDIVFCNSGIALQHVLFLKVVFHIPLVKAATGQRTTTSLILLPILGGCFALGVVSRVN